jgi:hypothetical protein
MGGTAKENREENIFNIVKLVDVIRAYLCLVLTPSRVRRLFLYASGDEIMNYNTIHPLPLK